MADTPDLFTRLHDNRGKNGKEQEASEHLTRTVGISDKLLTALIPLMEVACVNLDEGGWSVLGLGKLVELAANDLSALARALKQSSELTEELESWIFQAEATQQHLETLLAALPVEFKCFIPRAD